jgi:2,5-diketo-D-gluconate reductase A
MTRLLAGAGPGLQAGDSPCPIPKSSSAERQRTNLDVFGFELADAEMTALAELDLGESEAVDSDVHEEF